MRMVLPGALMLAGCQPADPLDEAWSGVFEVQRYASTTDGCDAPSVDEAATEEEAPADFVGVALGQVFDEANEPLYLATTYWCETEEVCDRLPFSNAQLREATLDRIEGVVGERTYDSTRICKAFWTGIEATLTGQGQGQGQGDAITLITRSHASENESTATQQECDEYLESLLREQCDETLSIEAVRVE